MGRLLDLIVGHHAQVERLLNAFSSGRLPHAMLFVGPSGVGKKKVAFALAQVLICEKQTGCGQCGPCLRVEKKSSEALLVIEPEKNQIKIDQAKSILEFLQLRTWGKNRVVLIDHAETMNPQAANSLLKVLEEPPQGTYFILIAPGIRQILPTLRSRSQAVRFSPVALEDMKKNKPVPEWALRASQGSFEKLAMLSEKEEIETRTQAFAILDLWMTDPMGYLRPEVKEIFRDRTEALRAFYYWMLILRDALYVQLGSDKDSLINADQKPAIAKLAERSKHDLLLAIQLCLNAERALLAQRDSNLVLEEFWLFTRSEVLVKSAHDLR